MTSNFLSNQNIWFIKFTFLKFLKCELPKTKVQIATKGPINKKTDVPKILYSFTLLICNIKKTRINDINPPKYPKAQPKFESAPILVLFAF